MGANNLFLGDINKVFGLVQSSMIVYPKEMIIATLKDYFSKDTYYHYVKDEWGFAKVLDHTGLPLGSGVHNTDVTRLFIGESFKESIAQYPSVFVKTTSMKYIPISINRNQGKFNFEDMLFVDGYGNSKQIKYPKEFVTEGIFEGSMSIDVQARSIRERDDISELIAMCLTEVHFKDLEDIGIIVKPLTISSMSESDDRNDKIHKSSITFDVRTEWRRVIPIKTLIESIIFSLEFQDLNNPESVPAQNLTINTQISLEDLLLNV